CRVQRLWPRLEKILERRLGPLDVQWTKKSGDAREIAASSKNSPLMIACGGDGTIHEVANGVLNRSDSSSTTLGILSLGTGSDLIKSLGIPSNPQKQIEILCGNKETRIDVGEMEYEVPGGREGRFFFNIADAGIGADVLRGLGPSRSLFGRRLAYLLSTIRSYRHRKPAEMTIKADGKTVWSEKALLVAVANGKSFGGGMQIAPQARLSDGLLDLVILRDLPPWWLPIALPALYLKKIASLPQVKIQRAQTVSISSREEVFLDIDGERIGSLPVTFQIHPAKLRVRIP
ncbi:MAG: diacylglycerol kinase family lipid kinase, partial [Deltaproteobacteria bacterium]|nr:diacylglycerol kinase family lipid kinase [Deltaproteobacteria bacterium]